MHFRPCKITTAILALLLLSAQMATVVHAAEHHFHDHQVYCDSFIAADHNGKHGAQAITFHFDNTTFAVFRSVQSGVIQAGQGAYHSRAPPAL